MNLKINEYLDQIRPKYHLHIEVRSAYPKTMHVEYTKRFTNVMNLRCLRRNRPTYLRLTNIENHSVDYAPNYRYVVDLLTSSLALTCELCALSRGHIIVESSRVNLNQLLKCFPYPIHIESVGPGMFQVLDRIHPLLLLNTLLAAFPKSIERIRFGLTHTLNLSPCVDDSDHFRHDRMPFPYKRITTFQPIRYVYENN